MNQTRILFGVCLALVAVVAWMFYQQQASHELLRDLATRQPAPVADPAPAAAAADPATAPPVAAAPGPAAADPAAPAPEPVPTPEDERLAAIERELLALKTENDALKEEKTLLFDENQRMRTEIDARLNVIRMAPMLAKVSDVVPEHRMVVITAGLANNIEAGEEFAIRREDSIVARIKVSESIEERESAAYVIDGTMIEGESVKPGDEVVKLD
jgi:hypothetical protein